MAMATKQIECTLKSKACELDAFCGERPVNRVSTLHRRKKKLRRLIRELGDLMRVNADQRLAIPIWTYLPWSTSEQCLGSHFSMRVFRKNIKALNGNCGLSGAGQAWFRRHALRLNLTVLPLNDGHARNIGKKAEASNAKRNQGYEWQADQKNADQIYNEDQAEQMQIKLV
ncbi:hypothetical protein YC2023_011685 [Brassica napus]